MKVTILGSGTLVPNGARSSAGYFLEAAGAKLMLECGAGTVHALDRYGVSWQEMSHLFISHFHVDHAGELASLFQAFRYGMQRGRTAPLTVVGPFGLERVVDGLRHAFGQKLFDPGFPVHFHVVAPSEKVRLVDGLILSAAKTPHNEESLAVRIETSEGVFCYTGDTDYSEELSAFFANADVLISECSFQDRREGVPHLSIRDAALMAARAGARRLVVTHFYFDVDEASLKTELEKYYAGNVIIGRDGMSISF